MISISNYSTLESAEHSNTAVRLGIDNTIPNYRMPAIINTAKNLDRVRELLQYALHIDSWYRCIALNRALGSEDTSQHIFGEAVDFICPRFGSPRKICDAIKTSFIQFDKLILEYTSVHISFSSNSSRPNRGEVYTLKKGIDGKISYLPGLIGE